MNEQQVKQSSAPTAPSVAATPDLVLRKAGTKQDVFTLDEGQAVLQWPDGMSKTSYEDFKDWIDLQLRKIGRTIQ